MALRKYTGVLSAELLKQIKKSGGKMRRECGRRIIRNPPSIHKAIKDSRGLPERKRMASVFEAVMEHVKPDPGKREMLEGVFDSGYRAKRLAIQLRNNGLVSPTDLKSVYSGFIRLLPEYAKTRGIEDGVVKRLLAGTKSTLKNIEDNPNPRGYYIEGEENLNLFEAYSEMCDWEIMRLLGKKKFGQAAFLVNYGMNKLLGATELEKDIRKAKRLKKAGKLN